MSLLGKLANSTKYLLSLFGILLVTVVITSVFLFVFGFVLRLEQDLTLSAAVAVVIGIYLSYVAGRRHLELRPRTLIVLTVVVWGLLVAPFLLAPEQGTHGTDADISGTIADDESDPSDETNASATHEVELDEGDAIRLAFDVESGQVHWELVPPDGDPIESIYNDGSRPDAVERTPDDDIRYTANRSGDYRITVRAEVYTSASYFIYVDEGT